MWSLSGIERNPRPSQKVYLPPTKLVEQNKMSLLLLRHLSIIHCFDCLVGGVHINNDKNKYLKTLAAAMMTPAERERETQMDGRPPLEIHS